MKSYLIANPKGGSGKSTLATNLAGYFARRGHAVMLGDIDRQQSSREWLAIRPETLPAVRGWDIEKDQPARPPKGASHAVLDTPAGLHGKALERVLKQVSRVIVPVQPSLFDILATRRFLDELLEEKAVRKERAFVAVVGMRVDPRTRAAAELERFLSAYDLPVLAYLRNTQLYVQLAANGMTLFDLSAARAAKDLAQWQPIIDWVDS
ncbi:ParA family protein [Propionivibrio limicola]|uniref:ParA family protein n=1 Tax=Propionivibrio limicola TaxID=167645 RepID=UPI001291D07D|nr:ParA family protein [Propionivibrio limicola]